MKLLHITDIHRDLENFEKARDFLKSRQDIAVAAITGDIAGICLDEEQIKKLNESFGVLAYQFRRVEEPDFDKFVGDLKRKPDTPDELRGIAQDYGQMEDTFVRNANNQYKEIRRIIDDISQRVIIIPGNWDSYQYVSTFGDLDINRKSVEINGVKFAGYGSSVENPIAIPITQRLNFSDENLYEVLTEKDADVVLTHIPPYGLLDKSSEGKSVGSMGLLAYLRGENPKLILCGHMHESIGEVSEGPNNLVTRVVNSGNFGKYPNSPSEGTMSEITLEDGEVAEVKQYNINAAGN